MLTMLFTKFKEAIFSVLPITIIVVILNFTPLVNLTNKEIVIFIVSSLLLIVGVTLFSLGADLSMTPMGEQVGQGLTKSNKLLVLLLVCFLLGVLITIAEPDLSVLAEQVKNALPNNNSTLLIVLVGLGVGLFLIVALLKIIYKRQLAALLMFFYMLLFAICCFVIVNNNSFYIPLAFDSGGVTTGPITVPFIMALGVGVALTVGGKRANENSFGLIAMCSIGPVIVVLILSIFMQRGENLISTNQYLLLDNFGKAVLNSLKDTSIQVLIAISLVALFFFVINFIYLHLTKIKLKQIGIGLLFTYVGLVIFLVAVDVGFKPVGYKLGSELAKHGQTYLVVFGFILGLVVVLAEPAIHVLNKQVEKITDGTVSKKSMMIALSIGVGLSIGLSMIRIHFGFSILYYLVPGYFISLGLSFFVPRMYTAIAFDSGGVASGPLTSSFILPFAIGACVSLNSGLTDNVFADAFGIVALVAMTPLITIQLLGFRAIVSRKMKEKIAMKRILSADDNQIIEFM